MILTHSRPLYVALLKFVAYKRHPKNKYNTPKQIVDIYVKVVIFEGRQIHFLCLLSLGNVTVFSLIHQFSVGVFLL